ncbi:hypothetical protein G9A89_007985 [Geosiphon pyriformis]|nr:hypothetical protein G9A89_007985 [Geosiphon pyriformis]
MGLLFTRHPKESPVTFGAPLAESENIGANHLGFTKSLFQQYSQQLGLNSNHYPAESVFNYYINDKITDCLEEIVNIKSARKNFYMELFQHTSLPRNHSFVPIIREINQTIERYMQQQFPITYADKDKGRIQAPAATPKGIQLPSWKKHRVESPTAPSYHYIPRSTIHISSADQQMAYASIAKLEKFTGNEDNTQTWINDVAKAIVANNWDNARAL